MTCEILEVCSFKSDPKCRVKRNLYFFGHHPQREHRKYTLPRYVHIVLHTAVTLYVELFIFVSHSRSVWTSMIDLRHSILLDIFHWMTEKTRSWYSYRCIYTTTVIRISILTTRYHWENTKKYIIPLALSRL